MKYKIGDKVRVKNPIGIVGGIPHDSTIDRGTYSAWVMQMDASVGKEFKIKNISEDYGYCLEDGWHYIAEWLELVSSDIQEIITKQYKTKDGKVFDTKEEAESHVLRIELQEIIESWQCYPISEVMDTIFTKYQIKRKS